MEDTESLRILRRTNQGQVHLLRPALKTFQKTESRDYKKVIDMCSDHIKKICPICKRVLFEGTEQEARGLIIYCPNC